MESFKRILLVVFLFSSQLILAQTYTVSGKISDVKTKEPISYAQVFLANTSKGTMSDSNGRFSIKNVSPGQYTINVNIFGYVSGSKIINVEGDLFVNFLLESSETEMEFDLIGTRDTTFGIERLKDFEGTSIYAGKKNEVIVLKDLAANTATNNSRQIYAKVPGLNIWENDGAGIQLGIGGRGLNPNRTSNFNTRQNGYDISADALGYPESYYSPPTEAVERIEIVRGAASLQYGTQFGGFINFKLKQGAEKPFEFTTRQTVGSFGFFNSFNSIAGTTKKVSYYAFYQHKSGNGWRPNSQFNVNAAFGSVTWKVNRKLSVSADYTFMTYLSQQPGGLTDKMFEQDPRQSLRKRNWFKVDWNLFAAYADYKFNDHLKLNTRFFGLIADRSALGLLIAPNRADPMEERDLWVDKYRNWGNETRLLYTYKFRGNPSGFVVGMRYYHGFTDRRQGLGNSRSTGKKSDFNFENPDNLEYSQYTFPSSNTAFFIENVFRVLPALSITPGVRFENIQTNAKGFYNLLNTDLAGNIIYKNTIQEKRTSNRSFVLAGIGVSYDPTGRLEVYGNISQNYRSINFNDMRVVNPNLRVDPNLKDEKGYTADLGIRGNLKNLLNYDLGVFMISYSNRIGSVLRTDTVTFNIYRFRTNVSASRNLGFESFAELNFWRLIKGETAKARISVFSNFSLIDARYINSKEVAYENKKVELVPSVILKTGLTYRYKLFSSTLQYSYTGSQYTDATNTEFTSNAVNGLIPSYNIIDLTAQYTYKKITFIGTVNNLGNRMYFTRRADAYPGPGIIPSDARSFFLTVQFKY